MTLSQIKSQLGIISLDLVRGKEKDTNKPTAWLRYWDNTNRMAVVVHEDVVNAIKANPSLTNLALKSKLETVQSGDNKGAEYMSHILIKADSIETTL